MIFENDENQNEDKFNLFLFEKELDLLSFSNLCLIFSAIR